MIIQGAHTYKGARIVLMHQVEGVPMEGVPMEGVPMEGTRVPLTGTGWWGLDGAPG
jgi:hypothetical protein